MYLIVNFKKLLKSFYRKKTYSLDWKKILIDKKIELNNKKTFLTATAPGGLLSLFVFESLLGASLKSRCRDVKLSLCDRILSAHIMRAVINLDEKFITGI